MLRTIFRPGSEDVPEGLRNKTVKIFIIYTVTDVIRMIK
jgi:hypothetical protein